MGRKSIAHIRRKEIIEGFFKVIAETGFANASIRKITEAAGVSKGVLHHYFVNKEAMVLGVMDHVTTTYMAAFQEEISRRKTATERMKFALSWFFDLERFNIEFSRAWMEFWILSKTDAAISNALQECYRQIKKHIADIIRDGIKSGEFRKVNPDVTANMIVGTFEGATMLWVIDTEGTPIKSMGRQIAKMYMDYLRA